MSLAFDENGRPFIILREQEKKKRVKGLEAHKVSKSILEFWLASADCLFLRTAAAKDQTQRNRSVNMRILDQHYGGTHCGLSFENIAWTKGHGQDARLPRW